jgi:hypothetical protein
LGDVGHRSRPGQGGGANHEGKQLHLWHRISPVVVFKTWLVG